MIKKQNVFPEESHVDGGANGELGQIFCNYCAIQACKVDGLKIVFDESKSVLWFECFGKEFG